MNLSAEENRKFIEDTFNKPNPKKKCKPIRSIRKPSIRTSKPFYFLKPYTWGTRNRYINNFADITKLIRFQVLTDKTNKHIRNNVYVFDVDKKILCFLILIVHL